MPLSLDEFAQQLTASGLLDAASVAESLSSLPPERQPADGEALARELVKQKKLTKFQAEQIYAGKGSSLILGNYVILDKLGQGGMGMVLKAEHRRMKRLVAIKVMSPTAVKTPDALKRFHREVEAAAKLRHPNIVAADDADEAKGTHFLVMEYVEGSDLSAFVKKHGPLPVEHAVRCIIQAARGLEYAHEQGIVHRDIKPANLLMSWDKGLGARGEREDKTFDPRPSSLAPRSFTIKILDMGLARIDDSVGGSAEGAGLTSTGTIMGTVDYMSPEQAMDTKHADARSDIYSLGCTLYYLLTGRSLYDGDTIMKKLMAHRESAIPELSGECGVRSGEQDHGGMPSTPHSALPTLNSVFKRMVAKKPQDRPQSMTEVIAELERCLSGGSATVVYERSGSSATNVAASGAAGSGNELQDFLRQISGDASTSATSAAPSGVKGTVVSPSSGEAETMTSSANGAGADPGTEQTVTFEQAAQRSGEPSGVSPRTVRGLTHPGSPKRKLKLLIGSIAAVVVVLLAVVLAMRGKSGTLVLEINDGEIAVTLGENGRTVKGKAKHTLRVPVGELVLHVEREEIAFKTDPIDIPKGKPVSVKVERVGRAVRAMQDKTLLGRKESPKPNDKETGRPTSPDFALEFDRGLVDVPLAHLDPNQAWTIEGYIHPVDTPDPKQGLLVTFGGDPWQLVFNKWSMRLLEQSAPIGKDRSSNSIAMTSVEALRGKRFHVAGVYDGQLARLFVEGKLIGSAAPKFLPKQSLGKLVFGHTFIGTMDEWRISKVGRYGKDFTPPKRYEPDADTLALYHFDEGQGDKLIDSSGNNHHGKIVRANWVRADGSAVSSNDPEREVAEWVISNGGDVTLVVPAVVIAKVADLPRQPFAVRQVNFRKLADFTEADALRLTRLGELQHLAFFDSTLSSGSIRALAGCRRLQHLFVSNGSTSDTTLSESLQIPQLRQIDFNGVAVSDEFVARLGQLPQLQFLQIFGCKLITEGGLVRMAAAPPPKLQRLVFSGPQVGAAGLRAIARLPHLQELSLRETQLEDAALVELARCPTLAKVSFAGNPVTQAGTAELQKALAGCQIFVSKPEQAPPLYGPAYRDTIRQLMTRGFPIGVTTNSTGGLAWVRDDNPFPKGDVVFAEAVYHTFTPSPVVIERADLQRIAQLSDLRSLGLGKLPPDGLRELLPLKNVTSLNTSSPLTDADIALLPSFPKLSNLSVVVPSDAALATIATLPHLSDLTIQNSSKITDNGLKVLESARVLSNVDLGHTDISLAAAQALANARPDIIVTAKGQRLDPVAPKLNGQVPPPTAPQQQSVDALEFDGKILVQVPSLNVDRTKPFTIEAWITPYKADFPNGSGVIFLTPGCGLRIGKNNWVFGIEGSVVSSLVPLEINRRRHLAGVRTENELLLFVDGAIVERAAMPVKELKEENNFYLGTIGKYGFHGQIDEVRISQGVRYPKEFTPAQRFESDDRTLAVYHFDEGQGNEIKDSSGNGHHGKVVDENWMKVATPKWVKVGATSAPPPAIAPFEAKAARAHQEAWAKHLGVPVEYTNPIGMKMVLIPPGEFWMGSPDEEINAVVEAFQKLKWNADVPRRESPRHRVTISDPFFVSATELTRGQFRQFAEQASYKTEAERGSGGTVVEDGEFVRKASVNWRNPGISFAPFGSDNSDDVPVLQVTWNDAGEFCRWLSDVEQAVPSEKRTTAQIPVAYSLPSEAQWEYACRAGTETSFWYGDLEAKGTDEAVFRGGNVNTISVVARKHPNPFGLYDMHGNAAEWCFDDLSSGYKTPPAVDPVTPPISTSRVVRGGTVFNSSLLGRSASRGGAVFDVPTHSSTFRVIRKLTGLVTSRANGLKPDPPPAKASFDAKQAHTHQEAWAKHLSVPVEYTNSIGMELR